jgi:hypothetical protein
LLWAWVLIVGLGGLDWIWADRVGLTFSGWTRIVWMLIFLLAVGVLYGYSGRDRRLADAGNYAAVWVAFSAAGAIFSYLVATFALPMRDAELIAIDAAMGFHWLAWSEFVGAHRALHLPLAVAYNFFLPQIIFSILYFAHTLQTRRNAELIWLTMVSVTITSIISAFVPALGPYVYFYGHPTPDIVVLTSLRAGGPQTAVINQLQGIITLPSFHTVMAIVFIYVHRRPSRSFLLVAVLNGLMLIAIPSEGHHYMIDMISGAAVAAISIAIVRAAMRPRSEPTSLAPVQAPRLVG